MDKKNETVTHIDDGRTIGDVSGVDQDQELKSQPQSDSSLGFKELWNTYWGSTKKIIIPMLILVGAMVVLFLLLAFLVM